MIKTIVAVLAILGISHSATAPAPASKLLNGPTPAPTTLSPQHPINPACTRTDGKPAPPSC